MRHGVPLSTALVFVLLCSATASAQVVDELRFLPGDEGAAPAVGLQREAAIAAGGGALLAVWTDYRTSPDNGPPFSSEGGGADIYAMRLDADGNRLDAEPFPLTEELGDQVEPAVSWNGTHFLVVWKGPNRSGFDTRLAGVRIAPDGSIVDSVPIHILGASYEPAFDLASNGTDWIVVYQGSGAGDSSMRAQRILADGTVIDPGGIELLDLQQLINIKVVSAGGEYLVVRRNSALAPQARRYDAGMQLQAAPFDVPRDFIGSSGSEYFVAWTQGGFIVGSPMSVAGELAFPDGVQIADATSVILTGFYGLGVAWDGTNWWVSWRHAIDGLEAARVAPDGTVLDFDGIPIDPVFEDDHGLHDIAGRPGGGAHLVWRDLRNGADDVYDATVSAAGIPGSAAPLATSTRAQLRADVAAGDGQALVVFLSEVSGSRLLEAQRLDAAGNPLDPAPLTVTAGGVSLGAPHVAWNGSRYLIVWSEGPDTWARRLNPDGTFIDAAPVLLAADFFDPDAAALGDTFLVVGRKETISSHFVHTFAFRYDGASASVLDAPFQISQYFARHPRVEAFGGRWLATWQRNFSHDDPQANAEAAFVEADGTPGGAFVMAYNGFTPHVAVSDTTAMFVFRSNSAANANNDVMARAMLSDGTFTTGPFVVAAENDRQTDPDVAWNGSEFVAFWTDKRNVTGYWDERTELFGARILEDGTLLDPQGFSFGRAVRPELGAASASIGGNVLVLGSVFRAEPGYRAFRLGYDLLGDEAPGNRWPVARAASDRASGAIPLTVNFDGGASSDPDGSIVTYDWDFGDGGTSMLALPEHTFGMVDDYLVQLQVADDAGARTTQTILVRARPVNQPPVARVKADRTSGRAPLSVKYRAAGSYDPEGTITQFYWTFGDGWDYYGGTAYHTYSEPGSFVTTLRVTDDEGATDTATITIDVLPPNQPPLAVLLPSLLNGPAPLGILFDGSRSTDTDGSIASWDWNFGDGATSTAMSPSHLYAAAGSFTVTLTVTDDEGGTDTDQVQIVVGPGEAFGLATADLATAAGSVSAGSYLDTHDQNDVTEALSEEKTSGSPATRQSLLEHTWSFDVPTARFQGFHVDAWHTANSEGDDFVFEYSRDQAVWTAMLTVTATSDDDVLQSYSFGEDVTGTLYVRVRDLDRTPGNGVTDTLYVDEMFVLATPSMGQVGMVPDGESVAGPPLYVDRGAGGDVTLSWGDSCMATDNDFGVYEGTIGDFGSHVPVACATGGATSLTFTPASGATYYLVVPHDGAYEGSYGVDSAGLARPTGLTACYPEVESTGCP